MLALTGYFIPKTGMPTAVKILTHFWIYGQPINFFDKLMFEEFTPFLFFEHARYLLLLIKIVFSTFTERLLKTVTMENNTFISLFIYLYKIKS